MFVNNLELDVIATFENHEQEWFKTSIKETALKSEKNLLKYIIKQLSYKDLIKLSLCWYCERDIVNKYKVIQESILKNGKYFFDVNTNKLTKEQ